MKPTVHFISGLGADSRAFSFLNLSFCNSHFISWPPPSANETLPSYAQKIFESINDEAAIIVGLSFGGMLATEIAKQHPHTKVIVISSCKTYREIPFYLRIWRYFPLYKLHNNFTKKVTGKLPALVLGVSGSEQQRVQRQILHDSDPAFTRWAIHAILNWKNYTAPQNVTHLHGTADNLLPYKYVQPHHTIPGGTHLMVMGKAPQVSALLKQIILDKKGY